MGVVAPLLLALGCSTEPAKDADSQDTGARVGDSGTGDSADTGETGDSADSGDSAPDSGTDSGDAPCDDATDTAVDGPDDDGDGFTDASQGGDDCDDERANVYPGAPDACDGLDQDCDGEAIPPGSCSEPMDVAVSAWTTILGDETRLMTDIYAPVSPKQSSGDAWLAWEASSGDGLRTTGFITGNEFLSHATYPAEMWRGWSDSYRVAGWPAGDVDGDGAPDAWIWWSPPATGVGAFLLKLGPLEDVTCGIENAWSWADAEVQNSDPAYEHLVLLDSAADIDGDGRDDFLVSLSAWDASEPVQIHLVTGAVAPGLDGDELADAPPLVEYSGDDGDVVVVRGRLFVPDVDGDGLDDLVAGNACGDGGGPQTGVSLFSGDDFVAGAEAGLSLADVTHFAVCGADETSWAYIEEAGNYSLPGDRATDFNGDGLPDLLAVVGDDVDGEWAGALTFLDMSRAGEATLEELPLTELDYGEGVGFGIGDVATTDFGARPLADQSFAINASGGLSCLVPLSALPLDGRVALTDIRMACIDYYNYPEQTQLMDIHDLDGDGFPEWFFSDHDYEVDGLEVGRIEIVRGFDIPYDDDTRW